jgi:hypothetical protein
MAVSTEDWREGGGPRPVLLTECGAKGHYHKGVYYLYQRAKLSYLAARKACQPTLGIGMDGDYHPRFPGPELCQIEYTVMAPRDETSRAAAQTSDSRRE